MGANSTAVPETIVTPEFRASFVYVFRPGKPDDHGKQKYAVTMLFPANADLSAMKKAAQAALIAKWGPDSTKWPANLRSPFRDQGEKQFEGYVKGCKFVTASSDRRPGIVDQNVQPILDESKIYSGCWCRASVRAFAYEAKGNRGVSFGLQNIQLIRDDEPLAGRSKPEDDFQPVEVPAGAGAAVGASANALFD